MEFNNNQKGGLYTKGVVEEKTNNISRLKIKENKNIICQVIISQKTAEKMINLVETVRKYLFEDLKQKMARHKLLFSFEDFSNFEDVMRKSDVNLLNQIKSKKSREDKAFKYNEPTIEMYKHNYQSVIQLNIYYFNFVKSLTKKYEQEKYQYYLNLCNIELRNSAEYNISSYYNPRKFNFNGFNIDVCYDSKKKEKEQDSKKNNNKKTNESIDPHKIKHMITTQTGGLPMYFYQDRKYLLSKNYKKFQKYEIVPNRDLINKAICSTLRDEKSALLDCKLGYYGFNAASPNYPDKIVKIDAYLGYIYVLISQEKRIVKIHIKRLCVI